MSCRICEHSVLSMLFSISGCSLVKCKKCSFVQVKEQPTEEQLKSIYNKDYFTHQKYLDQKTLDKENDRRLSLLQNFIPNKQAVILDAGCASGDFIRFAKHSYALYGFDFSSEAIGLAKKNNPELSDRLWVGGVENIGDPNLKFDAICLWDVIEHLWDPVTACERLMSFLKPGGLLLFSTPKIDTSLAKIMGKHWHFMTPPEHLSFLTKQSIQILANKTNSKLIKSFSRGKWGNIVFLLRKLKKKFVFVAPDAFIHWLAKSRFKNLAIYVPTNDIQYIVLKKVAN